MLNWKRFGDFARWLYECVHMHVWAAVHTCVHVCVFVCKRRENKVETEKLFFCISSLFSHYGFTDESRKTKKQTKSI